MKRVLVAIGGGALTLAGIVLLILPGPGFVLVAAGLAVLATQFEWAKRPLDYAKRQAQAGMDQVADSGWRAAFAALCALVLIGVGVVALAGVHIPFVNAFSAVLIIASGLFLAGTIVYARMKPRRPAAAGAGPRVR